MFVKPAPGRKVRDPISRLHLPETGKNVPEDTYWLRRVADKDVVIAAPPAESASPATAKASAATTAAPKKE